MKMFRDTRMVALTALLSALVIAAPVGAATAAAAQRRRPPTANGVGGGGNPGSYTNPLAPDVPGDGVVESCADPTVLQGQRRATRTGISTARPTR